MAKQTFQWIFYIGILMISMTFFTSCDNEIDNEAITLKFSTNEVTFDTIFTSIGTATQKFTAFNTSNRDASFEITLGNGGNSPFSINVNGLPGKHFPDVVIPAKDSIFIFVKANINPGGQNTPFLVTDSISFRNKSKEQQVDLIAYGQDAKFIIADMGPAEMRYNIVAGANEHVTWTNEKPIVVYGWAVVDSLGTLTIEPGTQVYFHNQSGLWVYRYGNLMAEGTIEEPLVFRGDRLEEWFDADFAQWNRIWINEGGDVSIKNALVTNAYIGIQIEPLATTSGILITDKIVTLENTVVQKTTNSGVLIRYSNVDMTNCLISNNGSCGIQFEGGYLTAKHVTIANYFAQDNRENPALFLSNSSSLYQLALPSSAHFFNSIIDGNQVDEFATYTAQDATFDIAIENCLIKTENTQQPYFNTCWFNENPLFIDIFKQNYELSDQSPAINKGKRTNILLDLLGKARDNNPDLGCYEY